MALDNTIKTIAGLVAMGWPARGATDSSDPSAAGDAPKAKHALRLGPPLLAFAAMSLVGGGLWITKSPGTVKIGVDPTGIVFEVNKQQAAQRDIVGELVEMKYADDVAAQVRQLRGTAKGPWQYPRLELAARVRPGIPPHEAAVCHDSELLGERLVLASQADRPEDSHLIDVAATLSLPLCSVEDARDQIFLLGPEDMKAIAGGDGVRELGVYGSVLAKSPTRPLPNATEVAGGAAESHPHGDES